MNTLEAVHYDGGNHRITYVRWNGTQYVVSSYALSPGLWFEIEKFLTETTELRPAGYGNVMAQALVAPDISEFLVDVFSFVSPRHISLVIEDQYQHIQEDIATFRSDAPLSQLRELAKMYTIPANGSRKSLVDRCIRDRNTYYHN